MTVLAIPEVHYYLDNLAEILFEKEYCATRENARKYAIDLFKNIKTNLPIKSHKQAPPHFDKYGVGMYYASFKKNRNTTWFAFFNKYLDNGEIIYLVRYINNNHMIAQYL